MDEYIKANIDLWNERTLIHAQSDFYGLESFKAGKSALKSIELEELGDVDGKSLLHLQCHFGLDTLSWARLGAKVTGVDFSEQAIALAQSLSQELKIEANFVCSNIYELTQVLLGEFDIVFTSYGVLHWLPDLKRWAETINYYLKPGGTFYIAEFHPFMLVFDRSDKTRDLKVSYPYFSPSPVKFPPQPSYADKNVKVSHPSYEWVHSLSDIINSLLSVGLTLEFLHEFPCYDCQYFPFMEQDQDGWWRLKGREHSIPLMFSLKATKSR